MEKQITLTLKYLKYSVFLIVYETAIVLVLCGCTGRNRGIQETKTRSNPIEIREAVMPLFLQYRFNTNNDSGFVVPADKVPRKIKSLPLFSNYPTNELYIMSTWVGNNDEALLFFAGSGFGHWGIVVCRDESDRRFDKWAGYEYWRNGIYFYVGQ